MTAIVQPSPEWIARVQQYFAEEGLRQTTREEFEVIPEDLRAGIPHLQDHDAPFGFRPPTEAEIGAFYDRLAPHYDALTMVQYNLEVRATAWLMEEIHRHPAHRIVDAGCGTGITLAFLSRHYPPKDGVLFGYDATHCMMERAGSRVSLHRKNDGYISVRCATHTALAQRDLLPPAHTDLLFTKCSFSAGVYELPMFDDVPMPSAARDDFYGNDPTMQAWRENLESFARVLRPGGTYIHIGVLADGPVEALITTAEEAGFACETRDPVWFEERAEMPDDFHNECMADLDAAEVPAEHRAKVIQRKWSWVAPALGALIFTRR